MNKKLKNGISLIVLVITIIVLAILAGAVIITLSGSDIIGNALIAVNDTNLKQYQEAVELAWVNAYVVGTMAQREDESYFRTAVNDYLTTNNIDITGYTLIVTTEGTKLGILVPWQYKADSNNGGRNTIVTNGLVDLKLGSTINYIVAGYTGDWQVLGAEDGKLLILSKEYVVYSKELSGKTGYINAVSELDAECAPFGTGTGAVSARCIRIEDVNKITGYNPNNVGVYDPTGSGTGTKYEAGTLKEYENLVTFSWDGTDYPHYVSTNGLTGSLGQAHTAGFDWYNSTTGSFINIPHASTGGIATLTSSLYKYYATSLVDSNSGTVVGLSTTSDEYKMLFANDSSWLASPCISNDTTNVFYNIQMILNGTVSGKINFECLARSNAREYSISYPIRAVVALSPDIIVTGNNIDGWRF